MLNATLIQLYERDLEKLKAEIEQYSNEADLWKTSGEITNSGGNLTLHLIGNLKHFIGAVLGNSGFVRDRDAEFSTCGVSRVELLTQIDAIAIIVKSTLEKLTDEDLAKNLRDRGFRSSDDNRVFSCSSDNPSQLSPRSDQLSSKANSCGLSMEIASFGQITDV